MMTHFFPTETPLVRPKDTNIVAGINLMHRQHHISAAD